ncbi:ABC transporter ATP-binding protein [Engelhardtia mirabilis]|uniref:Putative ABC transporter ATP-binding protein n=1 Tax=Engelhardtia mirabilis TaxID=2528011 RepID=A0A518BHR3_9BACT|nr:putative ABC transporter ATP-binding protein [Planctomycetes bacterium Pla133]QDV00837.1 putative ABC transporter ATP-binding protein [Planctomycetes bacterium Pla86]
MTASVALQGVFKFHGPSGSQTPILREVSFELGQGEFLCVMGPSGSGKSSLLHLIAGLDSASAGTIELAGKNLEALPQAERTRLRREQIGFVFQFFNLLPNLNVLENVGLPIAIRGERPERERGKLSGLLERFGVGGKQRSLPHQLSGGEMQRVSIARALAGDQPVLLCDEPTGNLSQQAGLEIMKTLRQVCDEDGKSVLLVTHNPRDAAFADRVLFLVDGQLDPAHALHGPNIPVEDVHRTLAELHI